MKTIYFIKTIILMILKLHSDYIERARDREKNSNY